MVLPPSTFAASSSTPSTGTCNRKKAILEPVCPHHRLPFAFAARLYLSRANQPWDAAHSSSDSSPAPSSSSSAPSTPSDSKALLIYSTPSTPSPPTSSPAQLSSPKINTIISTNKIAKSLASPIQTLPPPPSSSCPQPPPQADPNSEDEEYLRALDEAWEAFEAELDLKYGTGPYQININSQYQESLKDEMTDSASPATPTPASTS
ncbi:hypothetical protein PtB15_13B231 [Puccinia triticina]|nr:hypothetical protein PtB15_13B231 [Puccinia triticina]